MNFESTDDAFIDASIAQVSPKVGGRVEKVYVEVNQQVNAGDIVAEIEPSDIVARVDQANAALRLATAAHKAGQVSVEQARASLQAAYVAAQASVSLAEAKHGSLREDVKASEVEAERSKTDKARFQRLDDQVVSRQKNELMTATADMAHAQLEATRGKLNAASAEIEMAKAKKTAAEADLLQIDVAQAEVERRAAAVEQAEASLRQAQLELSYTKVIAPLSGRVTRKAVEPGNMVQAGQLLMAIVPADTYVTANFKETQLTHMKPGQAAEIHVDAYPGAPLKAHVDSLQAGSGARFSLLPPENATGNFVKVVQRIPVKIVFDEPIDAQKMFLGPGMSVIAKVKVR